MLMGKIGFSILMFSYFALTIYANLQSKQVTSRITRPIEQVSYGNGANVDSFSVKDGYEIVELKADSMANPIIYRDAVYEEYTRNMTPVYGWVNKPPLFVGDGLGIVNGEDAFSRYINNQKVFSYSTPRSYTLSYVAVIERNGCMSNIELKFKSKSTDSTTVERVSNMLAAMAQDSTLWLPGKHHDETCRVAMHLSIYSHSYSMSSLHTVQRENKATGEYATVYLAVKNY